MSRYNPVTHGELLVISKSSVVDLTFYYLFTCKIAKGMVLVILQLVPFLLNQNVDML